MLVTISLQVIMVINGCPLRLLWIWQRGWKCCKDYCVEFFATLEPAKKHYHTLSADEGRELTYIDDWSGFCGLKKVKCGNPSNLLWIAKYIGCGPINVVCVDLGKHCLYTLIVFPSVLMPRGQLWAKLLFYWAVTLLIRALLGSSKLQCQNFNQLLIKSLDGEAQSAEMDS